MGTSARNVAAAALPLAAAVAAPALGFGAIASAFFVGGAAVAGSMLSSPVTPDTGSSGLKANTRTTQRAIPVLYGTHKVGGNDVYIGMEENNTDILWIVQALAEGPCDGMHKKDDGKAVILINGKDFYRDEGTEQYRELIQWWFHDGDISRQAPSRAYSEGGNAGPNPFLKAAIPEFDDRMAGTCYIVFRIHFNSEIFHSIPTREIVINGKKVHGITHSGLVFSKNPVNILFDYITSERYGAGLSSDAIDLQHSWSEAAGQCEKKGEDGDKKWETNIAIAGKSSVINVVDDILRYCRSDLVWDSTIEKYKLIYRRPPSDFSTDFINRIIDDSDIARDDKGRALVSFSQPSLMNTPSGLSIKYMSEDQEWVQDDVVVGQDSSRMVDVDLSGFQSKKMALNMGYYLLERMKLNRSITVTLRPNNIIYETGDIVLLRCSELGWKWPEDEDLGIDTPYRHHFRVVGSSFDNGMAVLTLIFEKNFLYDDKETAIPDYVYKSYFRDPNKAPDSVENVRFIENKVVDRDKSFWNLHIEFDPPPDDPYYRGCIVEFLRPEPEHPITNPRGKMAEVRDGLIIKNVIPGDVLRYIFKSVNVRGVMQEDNDAYQETYRVRGVLPQVPCLRSMSTTVTASSVSITSVLPADTTDIESYEFRTGSPHWTNAIFLTSQLRPFVSYAGVKPGTHTFLCSPRRNDGSYCPDPSRATATVKDPLPGFLPYQTGDTAEHEGEALKVGRDVGATFAFKFADHKGSGTSNIAYDEVANAIKLSPGKARGVYHSGNISLSRYTIYDEEKEIDEETEEEVVSYKPRLVPPLKEHSLFLCWIQINFSGGKTIGTWEQLYKFVGGSWKSSKWNNFVSETQTRWTMVSGGRQGEAPKVSVTVVANGTTIRQAELLSGIIATTDGNASFSVTINIEEGFSVKQEDRLAIYNPVMHFRRASKEIDRDKLKKELGDELETELEQTLDRELEKKSDVLKEELREDLGEEIRTEVDEEVSTAISEAKVVLADYCEAEIIRIINERIPPDPGGE